MDKSNTYNTCVVLECKNTTKSTPNKLFINVPYLYSERVKWLQLANRDPTEISSKTKLHFCEDHFDLSKDMVNYMEYTMGFSKKIRMVEGCLPSKFECRTGRKLSISSTSTEKIAEKQKLNLVEKCEKTLMNNINVGTEEISHKTGTDHSLGLLVEMKRKPISRKRKLAKKKPNKISKLPTHPKENRPLTTASVRTQTEIFMNWKKFLTLANLDRDSMNQILGLPSLSRIIKFFKTLNISESLIKIQDQLILTVWKYRFNLNFDSYSYMFSYNDKTMNPNILNDLYRNGTLNLYKFVQQFEETHIEDLGRHTLRQLYLDVFEIPVTSHLTFDRMNYSTQRGTITFKAIVLLFVGNLQYLYVSDLYGGATKIAHIIKNSEIHNAVKYDDYIMYSDKITHADASLIHADIADSFPDDKKEIFAITERKLRKKFKILNDVLPIDSWPIANQIFHNCVALFNMHLKG